MLEWVGIVTCMVGAGLMLLGLLYVPAATENVHYGSAAGHLMYTGFWIAASGGLLIVAARWRGRR